MEAKQNLLFSVVSGKGSGRRRMGLPTVVVREEEVEPLDLAGVLKIRARGRIWPKPPYQQQRRTLASQEPRPFDPGPVVLRGRNIACFLLCETLMEDQLSSVCKARCQQDKDE